MSDFSLRERFGRLLDGAGQMFWELDRNFRVAYANDLFKRAFGDPVGKICHQFMACSDRICHECPVKKVFDGQERAVSVRMRRDTSGEARWLQHTATPIKNSAGEIIGASELTLDITSRKQIEERLGESERRYRNLVEQVPDVIFVLDPKGRFAYVNTQVEEFLGYPVRELLDTAFADYVLAEDKPRIKGILELGPDVVWDEEIGILDAKGNRKFARIRCKASFDVEGQPSGFEGVMRDRTARRKLEEELTTSRQALVEKIKIIDELYEHIVQSNKCKAIEEHTAEVAHELRQPLAIVGGFARRMARQLESNEELELHSHEQYVKIIVTEIERLERILDRLIDFTKRGHVRLQKINPNELIRYILEITAPRSKEKELRIDARLGPEIGEVPLDPGRFQQLVLNLLSNAIDASPRGGVVELETGASIPSDKALKTGELASDVYFEMKIRNDGPRVPAEELQQIFNPFYTTKEHGTGLGLTVSRKIVEDHSGSMSVRSDTKGTAFTVWLPLN